jgi:pimeloyl-ACP methyl ester carboxylesterase
MEATLNGATFHFETRGNGRAVLLIHGAVLADGSRPLFEALSGLSCRVVHYHRRAHGLSSAGDLPLSISQHASDARALLNHLGITSVHVVAHSYATAIALELAVAHPDVLASLVLIEPGLDVPSVSYLVAGVQAVGALYDRGERAQAVGRFLEMLGDSPARVETFLSSGSLGQAISDLGTYLRADLPAIMKWRFTADIAGTMKLPALSVIGSETPDFFRDSHDLLQRWLPNGHAAEIPGIGHHVPSLAPVHLAQIISAFIERCEMDRERTN